MKPITHSILAINCGSSSIKFALYDGHESLAELASGEIENIGTKSAKFSFENFITHQKDRINIDAVSHNSAGTFLIDWLNKQEVFISVKAMGHRIVHGMGHTAPELVTPALLKELNEICAFDPEHLPDEISLIQLFTNKFPALPQIVCFDTSFHTAMPGVAKLLAIPLRYQAKGVRRYGFHGISYAFLMDELKRLTGDENSNGRIILAHLGSGASLAAVKDGVSIDTSMGFTPASGLPMSTRTGDIDPGIAAYLMRSEKLSAEQFSHLINFESGLLGMSETSADMRELLAARNTDSRADNAVAFFCYEAQKWIGSYFVVLGGLDTIVFSGGIGQHSPEIRSQICDSLACLGVELDEIKNMNNDPVISTGDSSVCVRVIKTNEELMIGKMVFQVLNDKINNQL
jgi:acetate kinase